MSSIEYMGTEIPINIGADSIESLTVEQLERIESELDCALSGIKSAPFNKQILFYTYVAVCQYVDNVSFAELKRMKIGPIVRWLASTQEETAAQEPDPDPDDGSVMLSPTSAANERAASA